MIQLSDQSTRINDPKIPKQIITFSPNSNLLLFLQWTPRSLLSMWSFVALQDLWEAVPPYMAGVAFNPRPPLGHARG